MAIDQVAALEKVRARTAEVTGIAKAYAPSQTNPAAGGLPASVALEGGAIALILPGPTLDYILTQPRHRHTYEVRVLILLAGPDYSENAFNGGPLPDRVIEKFVGQVTLGGSVNSCIFRRNTGFTGIEWGGLDYLGYEITLELSEAATASAGTGT